MDLAKAPPAAWKRPNPYPERPGFRHELASTLALFELTFLTAGPDSQTLVVALYYSVFAAGVRATQSVDAMAVIYMVTTLFWLLIALRFVDPTQLVTRVKDQRASR